MGTCLCGESTLPHNKSNCFPPLPGSLLTLTLLSLDRHLQKTVSCNPKLCNLTVVHFNPQRRVLLSLLLNILHFPLPPPLPPYSMFEYNRTIIGTNIKVLLNIGPGAGERREKKRYKVAAFPTLITMIIGITDSWSLPFFNSFFGSP